MSSVPHAPEKTVIDILRIHVVWDAGSDEGARIGELISRHFDGIGMERDGVAYRVPVRFASDPWALGSDLPAPIDLDRARFNAIVLLHDDAMQDHFRAWDNYVQETRAKMNARLDVDILIPFGSPSGDPPLPSDAKANIQYAYRQGWATLGVKARDSRLLLHILHAIRYHLRGDDEREPLFVSHAKADGDTTARSIVDYVNNSGHDVPLETFYDAMELSPGEDYRERFVRTIERGTLLAIVSDVYDSRPWCVFELTTAKRCRRPIVLADIGTIRTSRTFPYGANLPKVRVNPVSGKSEWIESLLVEALSEGLRCDLFKAQAARLTDVPDAALVLPRPPELFDLIDADKLPKLILYPDPPIGRIEEELLKKALDSIAPSTQLKTLGELS